MWQFLCRVVRIDVMNLGGGGGAQLTRSQEEWAEQRQAEASLDIPFGAGSLEVRTLTQCPHPLSCIIFCYLQLIDEL